jgi:hypothetical protein
LESFDLRRHNFFSHILLITAVALAGISTSVLASPPEADWCQCVIFTLNLLGIQQIPGEYWSASSLAEPDNTGKTWMDYQGYKQRADGEMPGTGDLLVLPGGAEVITEQTWSGAEHLVPVPVSAWTGHIGIVLQAEKVEREGNPYTRVTLMSANWGVLAKNLGVVGSCYNVDESTFLIPEGYKKALFFHVVDPVKIRERMVNRSNRWALLGLTAGGNTFVDGFPINPSGFISYVMEPVNSKPLIPLITNVAENMVEIPAESSLPGDFLLAGKETEPGLGVVTQVTGIEPGTVWKGQVTYLPASGTASGPVEWSLVYKENRWLKITANGGQETVHFFRYRNIPGYPAVTNLRISPGAAQYSVNLDLQVSNGGTGTYEPGKIVARIFSVDAILGTPAVSKLVGEKEFLPVGALTYTAKVNLSGSLTTGKAGIYHLVIHEITSTGEVRELAFADVTVP